MTNEVCIILDNNEMIRTTLMEWLKLEFPQVDFYTASSGAEAMALCKTHSVSLLILDIELPDMNGFDLIEEIKTENLNTKFIMHSLHTDQTYIETAKFLDVFRFIPKNAANLDLISSVELVFRENRSQAKDEH